MFDVILLRLFMLPPTRATTSVNGATETPKILILFLLLATARLQPTFGRFQHRVQMKEWGVCLIRKSVTVLRKFLQPPTRATTSAIGATAALPIWILFSLWETVLLRLTFVDSRQKVPMWQGERFLNRKWTIVLRESLLRQIETTTSTIGATAAPPTPTP